MTPPSRAKIAPATWCAGWIAVSPRRLATAGRGIARTMTSAGATQEPKCVDRYARDDADDRLLCAEGQVRKRGRRILRPHAQQHDVGPVDDGLVAVGHLDGWV